MKLEVKSADLVKAIGIVQRIVGKSVLDCVIDALPNDDAGMIKVSAQTIEGARKFSIFCQGIVTHKGSVTIDPVILSKAITGKGDVELLRKADSSTLQLRSTSGKYKGELTCVEDKVIDIPVLAGSTINNELRDVLFTMLPKVSISPQFIETEMFAHIRMNSDGIVVGCFDNYHGGLSRNENITIEDELEFRLPLKYVDILKGLPSNDLHLGLSDSSVCVSSQDYTLLLPLLQTEEQSLDELEVLLDSLGDDIASFTTSKETLLSILKAQGSVYESTTATSLVLNSKGVTFVTKSSYGNLKEVLAAECNGEGKFSISVPTLLDMLNLLGKTVTVTFKDSVFLLKNDDDKEGTESIYLGSLLC